MSIKKKKKKKKKGFLPPLPRREDGESGPAHDGGQGVPGFRVPSRSGTKGTWHVPRGGWGDR